MIHDPRFWAAIGVGTLLALMILTLIFTESGSDADTLRQTTFPRYPYMPY
jgi:hypothetical protein